MRLEWCGKPENYKGVAGLRIILTKWIDNAAAPNFDTLDHCIQGRKGDPNCSTRGKDKTPKAWGSSVVKGLVWYNRLKALGDDGYVPKMNASALTELISQIHGKYEESVNSLHGTKVYSLTFDVRTVTDSTGKVAKQDQEEDGPRFGGFHYVYLIDAYKDADKFYLVVYDQDVSGTYDSRQKWTVFEKDFDTKKGLETKLGTIEAKNVLEAMLLGSRGADETTLGPLIRFLRVYPD